MNFFPRPKNPRPDPRPPQRAVPAAFTPGEGDRPKPNLNGTLAALSGIAITGLMMNGALPSTVARVAAIGTAASLLVSMVGAIPRLLRN